jgi:hypothetical protein
MHRLEHMSWFDTQPEGEYKKGFRRAITLVTRMHS